MRLNAKILYPSRQFRLAILYFAISIAAGLSQYSYADAPPRFTIGSGSSTGKFEKITGNSKKAVIKNVEVSLNEEKTGMIHEDIQLSFGKVIPLPLVVDERKEAVVIDIIESGTAIDETEENEAVVADLADVQPALAETAEKEEQAKEQKEQIDEQWPGWLVNYRDACQKGKAEQKMVLVYFYDTKINSSYSAFETKSLADEEVKKLLEDYICVRIPITAKLQPTEGKIIQLSGTDAEKQQLEELTEEADDVVVLSENVVQTDGKAVITQIVLRNPPTSDGTRYTAARPSGETVDASKLIAPGRDMGSVAQLKAETFDLTFPNLEQEIMLIRHPAFYEMLSTPGIAIIDFKHKDADYYGKIVSVFPFLKNQPYTVRQTRAMLTLPPGTVTQRSVIFAVRIHPDNPKSTDGELDSRLVEEARSASQYQADIRKQGHHNWDRRFQKINAYLPTELWACEVCAESWPGQHLLESAIECVDCWRFSEGHWSAVSAEHPYYGYDMKLGTNGIWYGTGVFGKWRHPTLATAGTLTGGESQQLPKR